MAKKSSKSTKSKKQTSSPVEKAAKKAYKANPDAFLGTVADVSTFIRQAVTGKTNSPDLYTVMQILGYERTVQRIQKSIEELN